MRCRCAETSADARIGRCARLLRAVAAQVTRRLTRVPSRLKGHSGKALASTQKREPVGAFCTGGNTQPPAASARRRAPPAPPARAHAPAAAAAAAMQCVAPCAAALSSAGFIGSDWASRAAPRAPPASPRGGAESSVPASPRMAAAASAAVGAVGATLDLVHVILSAAPARELASVARAACACKTFRDAAAPLLLAATVNTWHPVYLRRWWGRERAADIEAW